MVQSVYLFSVTITWVYIMLNHHMATCYVGPDYLIFFKKKITIIMKRLTYETFS